MKDGKKNGWKQMARRTLQSFGRLLYVLTAVACVAYGILVLLPCLTCSLFEITVLQFVYYIITGNGRSDLAERTCNRCGACDDHTAFSLYFGLYVPIAFAAERVRKLLEPLMDD